ncbi:MAG: linear amide C-N hydrolase [Promethearchaeota archaeon]
MKNIYQNDSCSTFLIKRSNKQYIGHNLDERTPNPVNGAVFINRRGENKIGISKSNLQEGFDDLSKHFTWVSRYGSITFNVYGKDMIDGGFNEKGLYIQEMTLIDGIPPTSKDDRLPTLTFEMWMQYVLDNYSEVQEVIDSLAKFNLEGYPWHFFVCDQSDDAAVIDFKEEPIISRNDTLPITLTTNYFYSKELANLRKYQGFGGDKPIDFTDIKGRGSLEKDTRFVHAASLIKNAPDTIDEEYAFKILKTMDRGKYHATSGGRHWWYVIDPKKNFIYVETRAAPARKIIDLSKIDFSKGQHPKFLDIHQNLSGLVNDHFQPFTKESILERLEKAKEWEYEFVDVESQLLKQEGEDLGIVKEFLEQLDITYENLRKYYNYCWNNNYEYI